MGRNITINSFFCQSEVMAKCIVSLPSTLNISCTHNSNNTEIYFLPQRSARQTLFMSGVVQGILAMSNGPTTNGI